MRRACTCRRHVPSNEKCKCIWDGSECLQQCTEYADEETCNAQGRCNWYGWVCVQPCTELPDEETCNAQDDWGVRKCNWDGSACLQETDEDVPVGVLVAAIAGPTVGLALLVLTVVCVCKNKKAQPSGRAASDSVVVQGDPMGAKAPVGRTAV